MPKNARFPLGRVNVRLLVVLLLVVSLLGGGALVARSYWRGTMSAKALAAGKEAYARQDWRQATTQFAQYLWRNPNDAEILKLFAKAHMSVRPLEAGNIESAVGAYQQLIRLQPQEAMPYEQLASIYSATLNYTELAHLARQRMNVAPGDLKAPLWLGEVLLAMGKPQDARQALEEYAARVREMDGVHPEYVQACILLSRALLTTDQLAKKTAESLRWLNLAVDYDWDSADALLERSRFYRTSSGIPGMSRESRLSGAWEDLLQAEKSRKLNPRNRLAIAREWMEQDQLDRAAAQLEALRQVSWDDLSDLYFDRDDWEVSLYQVRAELAVRRDAGDEGLTLTAAALGTLKEARHRVRALPLAIRIYSAADGHAADASRCLKEFISEQTLGSGSVKDVPYLSALVARAQDKPYLVIEALEPAVVSEPNRAEQWNVLAEALERTGQFSRAAQALWHYLRLSPSYSQMALRLAREYIRLGNWSAAADVARTAEQADPSSLDARLLRIEGELNSIFESGPAGDSDEVNKAAGELDDLAAKYPLRCDIRVLQSLAGRCLGRDDLQEQPLRVAIQQCDDPLPAHLQLAQCCLRGDRFGEAAKIARDACDRFGSKAEGWLMLSEVYQAQQQISSAREAIAEGLKCATDAAEQRKLQLGKAALEMTCGDRAEGIKQLQQLSEADPADIVVRVTLLGLPEVRQDTKASQKLVDELRRIEGDGGVLWRLSQAHLWMAMDDWRRRQNDIIQLLQRCADIDPASPEPVLMLVEMYRRIGQPDKAEHACRVVLAHNPAAAVVAEECVSLLEIQGRFADARRIVESVQADRRTAAGWNVRLLAGAGDYAAAIRQLKLSISPQDKDVDSRVLLARLLQLHAQDTTQALEYLRQALMINPDSLAAKAAKVEVLVSAGRKSQAEDFLNKEVAACPSFETHLLRAKYLQSQHRPEDAQKDYSALATFKGRLSEACCELAEFFDATGRPDDAVACLEKGLKESTEDQLMSRELMRRLLARARDDDRVRAQEILSRLESQSPDDAELLLVRASLLQDEATGDSLRQAADKLKRAVSIDPMLVEAHLSLVQLALQREDYSLARDLAIRAMGSNPQNSQLLLARARAELAMGGIETCADLARLALRMDSKDLSAMEMLADAAVRSRDRKLLAEAGSLVAKALEQGARSETLELARSRILEATDGLQAATEYLRDRCSQGASVEMHLALAELLRRQGQWEAAKQQIDQAESLDPQHPGVGRARLVWLGAQGRFDEVLTLAQNFAAQKPPAPGALLAADILAASESHQQKAMELYSVLAQELADPTDALLGESRLAYRMDNVDLAEATLRKVLEKKPDCPAAMNDLAWLLAQRRNNAKAALELADRALTIAPDNRNLLDTRGNILSTMPNRLEDARKNFERLSRQASDDPAVCARALLQVGRLCAALGEPSRARVELAQALRLDSEQNVLTPQQRAEVKGLLSKLKTAGEEDYHKEHKGNSK